MPETTSSSCSRSFCADNLRICISSIARIFGDDEFEPFVAADEDDDLELSAWLRKHKFASIGALYIAEIKRTVALVLWPLTVFSEEAVGK